MHDKVKEGNIVYLITTYCDGGNLEDFMEQYKGKGIGEKKATEILLQIVEAFSIMIKYKIIHRDLKLANIFFHKNNIVIGDFGFAKMGESMV